MQVVQRTKINSDLKQKRYERCYEVTTPCGSTDRWVRTKTYALVIRLPFCRKYKFLNFT